MAESMSGPQRIQLSRRKGWRMPANTISVARPNRWGNPYTVAEFGPDESVRLFAGIADGCWSPDLIANYDDANAATIYAMRCAWISRVGGSVSERIRCELRGHNLACWCAIGTPCHAEILLGLANR